MMCTLDGNITPGKTTFNDDINDTKKKSYEKHIEQLFIGCYSPAPRY